MHCMQISNRKRTTTKNLPTDSKVTFELQIRFWEWQFTCMHLILSFTQENCQSYSFSSSYELSTPPRTTDNKQVFIICFIINPRSTPPFFPISGDKGEVLSLCSQKWTFFSYVIVTKKKGIKGWPKINKKLNLKNIYTQKKNHKKARIKGKRRNKREKVGTVQTLQI